MQGSGGPKRPKKPEARGCAALCCACRRLSVSSSESNSEQFATISSLAHAMVQERLDQMIRERHEEEERRRRTTMTRQKNISSTKFVMMVATEKSSHDPREDFRESMVEMITANQIRETRDLRRLLNCYVSMNSQEHRGVILEVFHEVCSDIFLCCKCH
ncbi:hypothetical protein NMG60_11022506 [Bertholletia excelsa]